MAELTLKRGYPGGSNLITRAFNRRELSAGGCRRESQKDFKCEEELTCFCLTMEGATWERVCAASKSKQQSLTDSHQGDRDLHPTPARNQTLPTPEWAWEKVLPQRFQVRVQLVHNFVSACDAPSRDPLSLPRNTKSSLWSWHFHWVTSGARRKD